MLRGVSIPYVPGELPKSRLTTFDKASEQKGIPMSRISPNSGGLRWGIHSCVVIGLPSSYPHNSSPNAGLVAIVRQSDLWQLLHINDDTREHPVLLLRTNQDRWLHILRLTTQHSPKGALSRCDTLILVASLIRTNDLVPPIDTPPKISHCLRFARTPRSVMADSTLTAGAKRHHKARAGMKSRSRCERELDALPPEG